MSKNMQAIAVIVEDGQLNVAPMSNMIARNILKDIKNLPERAKELQESVNDHNEALNSVNSQIALAKSIGELFENANQANQKE